MTPEERQILTGLFDRIRANSGGPRDPQAESFIAQAVQQQPWAPYLLAQNVIVMEQALQAGNQRIQELEGQLQAAQAGQGGGSFLGNVGRSIFGGAAPQPMQGAAPQQQQRYAPPPPPQYAPPQQPGPWGQAAPQASGGGGFLKGALGAAAGVAGGMLLADSVRGMFGGHGGGLFGGGAGQGEAVVNNYYSDGSSSQNTQTAQDQLDDANADQDTMQDAADTSDSFDSGGDSGSYDA